MTLSSSALVRAFARLLFLCLCGSAVSAGAEIVGENVVAGEVEIEHAGDVTTIHASDGAIIQYEALNVWAHEELHFVQPDATARVLNQVFGDATHIDGGLFANGIVYILNPAGIFFGGEAIVDVGGLVAAAGQLGHDDFLAGQDRFALSGPVVNEARIQATSVALLGSRVTNHGSIHAPDGTIALVAGERVLLTSLGGHLHIEVDGVADDTAGAAIEHTGTADAGEGSVRFTTGDVYSLALNHEGITRGRQIELRAGSGLVRVAGELDASAAEAGAQGGDIAVTGELVSLEAARLDASGAAGGGSIRVGGDLRGAGALPNARRTAVDSESRLVADALAAGDGGTVIVWADEATAFAGSLSARGGAQGGDGGFAEVSGAVFLWSDGDFDLSALRGENGTLLFDPLEIQILGASSDGSDDPDGLANRLGGDAPDDVAGQILFTDVGNLDEPFRIFVSEIEGTDADIVLQASHRIFSTETLDISLLTDRSLDLETSNAVDLPDAGIDLPDVSFHTSGSGSISMQTGTLTDDDVAEVVAPIRVASLSTEGQSVTLETHDGAIHVSGAIDTRGAGGATGSAGGALSIRAGGEAGVMLDLGVDTRGGAGTAGDGGAGGSVVVETEDGAITLGSSSIDLGAGPVDVSIASAGGDGSANGGAGGFVFLGADEEADPMVASAGESPVTLSGDVVSRGGDGGSAEGDRGGSGGSVTLSSEGEAVEIDPEGDVDPLRGGGALSLGHVDTRGGSGSIGGRGGNVLLETTDGAISVGSRSLDLGAGPVDVSVISAGGAGDVTGGSAGNVNLRTRDSNQDDANHIDAALLYSAGGDGTSGRGGRGGEVLASVFAAQEVLNETTEAVIQSATGSGNITLLEGIVVEGGDGGTFGGNGGIANAIVNGVPATAFVPTVQVGDADTPAVQGRGGDGPDGGGHGARIPPSFFQPAGPGVQIGAAAGDVRVGAIDTRGGDATGADATGGDGGGVQVAAGFDEDDPAGTLLLLGNVDAREGASTITSMEDVDLDRLASVDSGDVELRAADGFEHGGQAGPHVRTSGFLRLESGGDLGAASPLLVEGEGELREVFGVLRDLDMLEVDAGGRADVQVVNAGFLAGLDVEALGTDADIDVVQPGAVTGADRVSIRPDTPTQVVVDVADGTGNQVAIAVRLSTASDTLDDPTLVIGTEVLAGEGFEATSHGNLVLGTSDGIAIRAGTLRQVDPEPGDAMLGADVILIADFDRDSSGVILDAAGAASGRIELDRDGQESSALLLGAGHLFGSASDEAGIGTRGDPLVIVGGGVVQEARVRPVSAEETDPLPMDPASGIFLRNEEAAPGEASSLEVELASIESGEGGIEIVNTAGDLLITGRVDARPTDPMVDGPGGDVLLEAAPSGRIVLGSETDADPDIAGLESGGRQTWRGAVELDGFVDTIAGGGLEVDGTLDSAADGLAGRLDAQVGGDSHLGGDVGAQRILRDFDIEAMEATDPLLTLDLASVETERGQTYGTDVEIAQDVRLEAGTRLEFGSSLDAAAAADAAATLVAGNGLTLSGDVGALNALRGLDLDSGSGLLRFDAVGAQRVVAGADGIVLDSSGSPGQIPGAATLARTGGSLELESTGDVLVADGEKFTGSDDLVLTAPTGSVRFTDLSLLGSLAISADRIQAFARKPGELRLAGGGFAADAGTDVFASDVSFTANVFEIVGPGAAPRIATPSGAATDPGPLMLLRTGQAPVEFDIAPDGLDGVILDLAIPLAEPGFETHEFSNAPIEVPQDLWISRDSAAPGAGLGGAELVAFLGCELRDPRGACAPAAGSSPLRSERAAEIARSYRALLEGGEYESARRALAEAAAEPGAPLVGGATHPYLMELARLLARTRMLGLDPAVYVATRDAVLEAVVAAVGSPQLDVERLWRAVGHVGQGLPLQAEGHSQQAG